MNTLINQGKICPYCQKSTQLVDSAMVYQKSYGLIYYCEPCYAWVGTHKDSTEALGRLANAELREYKKQAHSAFDVLWKFENDKRKVRSKLYLWLSRKMKMPLDKTHIGMFDVDQCKKVIKLCQSYPN